jgi:hypothetical protein
MHRASHLKTNIIAITNSFVPSDEYIYDAYIYRFAGSIIIYDIYMILQAVFVSFEETVKSFVVIYIRRRE